MAEQSEIRRRKPVDLSRAAALIRLRMVSRESLRRVGVEQPRCARGARGFGVTVERPSLTVRRGLRHRC